VAKPSPSRLKVYKEQSLNTTRPLAAALGSLPEVLRAFKRVTGWSLQYSAQAKPTDPIDLTWSAPVNPGAGTAPGLLRLDPVGSAGAPSVSNVDPKAVCELASAVAGMLSELLQAQHALWQREAELAAGVPLVPQPEAAKHLAARLQAILKGGAEAVGCHAAALYLLDEATTSLKLRSLWGLPPERLTHPSRPLQGALAELEALLGHAVVVHDTDRLPQWNPPEDFPTALCVPVSTPTTILGTLWVFSNQKRDFDARQANLIEIVAGRLAVELEREMLLRVGIEAVQRRRELAAAERLQRSQLPTVRPLLDGWDMAGWTSQTGTVGGNFFDWFSLPDGLLAVAVGDAIGVGLEAALTANAVRAALRAHGQYHRRADRLLNQLNLTLWTGSAGDQAASLFCGLLEPSTGQIQCAAAAQPGIILLRPNGWQSFTESNPPLAASAETTYRQRKCRLEAGEALLAFALGPAPCQPNPPCEESLAQRLVGQLCLPAEDLVTSALEHFEAQSGSRENRSCSALLVVRRAAS